MATPTARTTRTPAPRNRRQRQTARQAACKVPFDLDRLVKTYNIDNLYEQYKQLEFLDKLDRYIDLRRTTVIELGSASGQMTELLSRLARKVIAVDGSKAFIQIARQRLGQARNVVFHQSYFENCRLSEQGDCLILHHVLEHVRNPVPLLSALKPLLKKDGVLALSVPNAHALSRQLAVKMRLLPSVYDLTANDRHHGHYRVYDWQQAEEQVTRSGWKIVGRHGLSFKLFADRQNLAMLEANIIGEEQIRGLWQLGDEWPAVAGAIMIVARHKQG